MLPPSPTAVLGGFCENIKLVQHFTLCSDTDAEMEDTGGGHPFRRQRRGAPEQNLLQFQEEFLM